MDDFWSGYARVQNIGKSVEISDLLPKFIKLANNEICICKKCVQDDTSSSISKDFRFKEIQNNKDETEDTTTPSKDEIKHKVT